MGKNSTPQYNPPPAPKVPTADELYSSATNYAKQNSPLAFGAREGALTDLAKGSDYYAGFQPTSFENALSNKYFQNVWPDTQESILHGLSLSGLDSSPLVADRLGKARGGLETQIGQYLSDQGNQRAQYSLNSRLGIDPMSMTTPYVTTGANQGNLQAQYNYDSAQQQAQAAYQQAIDKYNQRQAMYKTIGMFSPLGGAIYGGINGGGGGLLQSLGGSMQSAQTFLPMMMGGTGGLSSMFESSAGASPVNPYQMSGSQGQYGNYFGH